MNALISMLPTAQLICFAIFFLANGARFFKATKELNLIPILIVFTALVTISYGLYLMELFIAWYGQNQYESYSLEPTSWTLIVAGSLLSLIPLTGWIQFIRDRPLVYTLLLGISAIWIFTTYIKEANTST